MYCMCKHHQPTINQKKTTTTTEPPGLRADGGGHTAGLEHLQTIQDFRGNMLVSGRVVGGRSNIVPQFYKKISVIGSRGLPNDVWVLQNK